MVACKHTLDTVKKLKEPYQARNATMAIRGHTDTGFAATLRAAVEQLREASGADIVAL